MTNHSPTLVGLLLLVLASGGCSDSSSALAPSASPSTQPPPGRPEARLIAFTEEGTGFSTNDLYDAEDEILQINTQNQLIWRTDGAVLAGYTISSHSNDGVTVYWISGSICPEDCAFEVRFGATDGQRRAYLTVDYGHDNPGTLVDVEVAEERLIVTRTSLFPPGSPTLSGVVHEQTSSGRLPVEGASIALGISSGWRYATTDARGSYELRGLFDGGKALYVTKDGFVAAQTVAPIKGDTSLDLLLVRR